MTRHSLGADNTPETVFYLMNVLGSFELRLNINLKILYLNKNFTGSHTMLILNPFHLSFLMFETHSPDI